VLPDSFKAPSPRAEEKRVKDRAEHPPEMRRTGKQGLTGIRRTHKSCASEMRARDTILAGQFADLEERGDSVVLRASETPEDSFRGALLGLRLS
jgi:hypothetical protein